MKIFKGGVVRRAAELLGFCFWPTCEGFAYAQNPVPVDVVVVVGSSCPTGWQCYTASSGDLTYSFATSQIYMQASLREILAELKAEKNATLGEIVRKALDKFKLTCNPGLSEGEYIAAQVAQCARDVTSELSRSISSLLLPAFGFSSTTILQQCSSNIAFKMGGVESTQCSAAPTP